MKNILKSVVSFAFVFRLVSYDDDEKVEIPALPITAANLNETWQLPKRDGQALAEGTYCYIIFDRKELIFEMYQKFGSMYVHYVTGSFNIENDSYLGYIISGEYDFDSSDWNNDYAVTDLLESGSMIWIVKDDGSDVNKYVRYEKIPESIIEEAKTNKN